MTEPMNVFRSGTGENLLQFQRFQLFSQATYGRVTNPKPYSTDNVVSHRYLNILFPEKGYRFTVV